MEPGQRAARKGRKLGSSRRRLTREPAAGQDAPAAPEPWPPEAAEELQGFFQACGAAERGFVTRADLAAAKLSFLSSEEEPEMIFDWVDLERKGRLSLEEFSSGLKSIFGSSPSTQRVRGRRPLWSKRGSAATSFPVLEEADAEEKEAFLAFMEQLGGSHSLPEQEIWQLWGKLRQEEPQLAGNLEGFLAQMTSRLQEARADKESLELTLRKRDSDHQREVQRLYEEMEQQIGRQKQQLQAKSESRDLALSSQMQEVLEAKEQEAQRLVEGQRELEAELRRLSGAQREAGSEKQQLREAQRALAARLEQVQGQLQATRGHLSFARSRVSWQVEAEPSAPRAGEEVAPDPQAASAEEAPLPGLFGDNDDWDQLLSGFNSPWHRTPQLLWSPPATPTSPSAPQPPRVVRQISISEQHRLLSGREPSPDPDAAPRSPPGPAAGPEEGSGEDAGGQGGRAGRPAEPRSELPPEEPGPGPESRFFGEPLLPEAPAGASGRLVAAALKVLVPQGDGPPPQGTSPPAQAPARPSTLSQTSDPEDRDSWTGPVPAKLPRQREALLQGPQTVGSTPGLEPRGARVLPAGVAEPSEGLEGVAEPSEGLEGELGPEVLEGRPAGLREAPGQAQPGGPPAPPQQSLEEEPGKERKQGGRRRRGLSSELPAQAGGLRTGRSELPQPRSLPAPLPADTAQAPAAAEGPAPGRPSPPRDSPPLGAQPKGGAGPQPPENTLPSTLPSTETALQAQPGPPPTAEGEQGPPQPRAPRAEDRPEDPGAGSGGAGLTLAPGVRTGSESPADPDHIFHVIFLGDSNVGKTSFLHLLHQNTFASGLTATVGVDFRVKNLLVDNKYYALQLWDTAGQERYHSMTRHLLRKADGVVLMYDVTSQESFAHVHYWLDCLRDSGPDGVAILLLGNKMDCEEERQVSTEAGRQLAQELGLSFGECSAALGHNILEPMVSLARSLKRQEDLLKGALVEVAPERPPKKAGCCS
ncbi:ras-related protein Rab-44 [Pipistrellus kuhlii]|uniref:ras-related protein Rab-44 n=1 Tax=Pipistrellus kuhlii TaxID=59472 RepID=UPI00174EF740|nr:ras-related protein Rab-44 [Pipistrellus kuhlii]